MKLKIKWKKYIWLEYEIFFRSATKYNIISINYSKSKTRIAGYFWGPESLCKDFLKSVKKEFGFGHAA